MKKKVLDTLHIKSEKVQKCLEKSLREFDYDVRQKSNREIVKILGELVELHPELRFGQILMNYGVVEALTVVNARDLQIQNQYWVDEFNLESIALLKRVALQKAKITPQEKTLK